MESNDLTPGFRYYETTITVDEEEVRLGLSIVEFDNAIIASLYDNRPKLGSLSISYQISDNIERHVLFSGKNEELASALCMMITKKSKTMVYGSVNVSPSFPLQLEHITALLEPYFKDLAKQTQSENTS